MGRQIELYVDCGVMVVSARFRVRLWMRMWGSRDFNRFLEREILTVVKTTVALIQTSAYKYNRCI